MSDAPPPGPSRAGWLKNLSLRLLTAAVGLPGIFYMLYGAPTYVFGIFSLLVAVVAAIELATMTLVGQRLLQTSMVLTTAGLEAVVLFRPDLLLTGLSGVLLIAGLLVLVRPRTMGEASSHFGWLIAGPVYLGVSIGLMARLHLRPDGGSWVLLAMCLAWGSDTGSYFAGRAFGRTQLYASISPKKTVEGALGGLITIVAMAIGMHYLFLPSLPVPHAVGLALVAGVLGQAGDLCISIIKRGAGVKDSGFLIPGHGGLLDRIDALLFTAVTTFLYTRWLQPLAPSISLS